MDLLKNSLRTTCVLMSLLLTACQLPYLAKSAFHQTKLLTKRENIQEVLKDPNIKAEDKRKLSLALEARAYAEKVLNLKVEDNYSTFVQLENPYVTYVVNASEKFELKNHLWRFPIIGAVPYKGFPNPKDAEDEAKELAAKNLDTYVRGVSAYSTLGWFSDPILSSMLRYQDHDLVNTIIHESVHATIYIESNADFNESLASFVGDVGTELFYLKREGANSPTLKAIKEENADSKLFNDWIKGQLLALEIFYKNLESKNEPLRQAAFDRIRRNFEADALPFLKTNLYKKFGDQPLNNARLLLYKTYSDDVSHFAELYSHCKENLGCFFSKISTLKGSKSPSADLIKLNASFQN